MLLAAPAWTAEAPLATGTAAPDIALADQHGRPVQLGGILERRRFAVVAFYVKAFTGG